MHSVKLSCLVIAIVAAASAAGTGLGAMVAVEHEHETAVIPSRRTTQLRRSVEEGSCLVDADCPDDNTCLTTCHGNGSCSSSCVCASDDACSEDMVCSRSGCNGMSIESRGCFAQSQLDDECQMYYPSTPICNAGLALRNNVGNNACMAKLVVDELQPPEPIEPISVSIEPISEAEDSVKDETDDGCLADNDCPDDHLCEKTCHMDGNCKSSCVCANDSACSEGNVCSRRGCNGASVAVTGCFSQSSLDEECQMYYSGTCDAKLALTNVPGVNACAVQPVEAIEPISIGIEPISEVNDSVKDETDDGCLADNDCPSDHLCEKTCHTDGNCTSSCVCANDSACSEGKVCSRRGCNGASTALTGCFSQASLDAECQMYYSGTCDARLALTNAPGVNACTAQPDDSASVAPDSLLIVSDPNPIEEPLPDDEEMGEPPAEPLPEDASGAAGIGTTAVYAFIVAAAAFFTQVV